MQKTAFFLILLLVHLLLCAILFFCIKCDILKFSAQIFPLALFVPFWGLIMLIGAEIMTRHASNGTKQLQVDDFKLKQGDFRGNDLMGDEQMASVVPLEEAIFVNDAKTRRQFMLDIISRDPKEYIELLQKAKFNDDIEVIHYASTAIMEIQREYELDLQKKEIAFEQNPQDIQQLDAFILALKNYIGSGLVEDNILIIQRERYNRALQKRLQQPNAEPEIYFDAADNLIELDEIGQAEEVLAAAEQKWPQHEQVVKLRIKLCHKSHNGQKLRSIIEHVKQSGVYLSPQIKSIIQFWDR